MPKALEADWEQAKQLYIQGMRHAVIAEKLGVPVETIRKRAHRGKWNDLRQKTQETLSMTRPEDLGGMVNHWIDRLNRACVGHLEQLESKPKKSLKDLKEAAETLKLLGDTQYKNLGRDAESNTIKVGLVNVTLVTEAYKQQPEQVIDIQADPSDTP